MTLETLLHQTFGFSGFRANQEAVCRAATDGRDVLLVMPTGAGKSLCYQLPAIARGGTALVISPLIALMDDQAAKLSALGLNVARIHSGLSREQSREACRDYLAGTLNFLFIAPERMRVPGFPEMLAKRKPALIAIDEAHCISAWGHDFRPDYRTLGEYLPSLRPAPIIALTATATPTVQQDIVNQLRLESPALFIHGFRRDNLQIEVVEMSKPRRNEFVTKLLTGGESRPAIVYAPSRKAAEELASQLGGKAAAYHAGLEPDVRERVQRHFLSGQLEVVVATIAFGMGIDKADVRTVVHTALPASVEAYYQEIGRAGRDGKPSRTLLLYSFADRKMHDFFLERDYPAAAELARVLSALTMEFQSPDALRQRLRMTQEVFNRAAEKLVAQGAAAFDIEGNIRSTGVTTWKSGYETQLAFRRAQIDRMMAFAQSSQCRMTALIQHFGDTEDGSRPCGHCDVCAPHNATAQPFREPSAVEDSDLRAILDALRSGSPARSTGKLHSEVAPRTDRKVFDTYLDALARAGMLQITTDTFTNGEGNLITYKKAALTYEGKTLGAGEPMHALLRDASLAEAPSKRNRATGSKSKSSTKAEREQTAIAFTPEQKALEANLRAWRKTEAAKTGKPPFIVFGDSVLHNIVAAQPRTIAELLRVNGIGPEKADRYGAEIIALCRNTDASTSLLETSPSASSKRSDVKKAVPSTPATSVRAPQPPAKQAAGPETFTPAQQALDTRLRNWRAAEAEKLGLPQFFLLSATTLRAIVREQPRTLAHLRKIEGIGQDKLDRFGAVILMLVEGSGSEVSARPATA